MLARALRLTLVVLPLFTACAVEQIDTPKLRPSTATDAGPVEEAGGPAPTPTSDASVDVGVDTAPIETFLSDMTLEVVANGYGPLEKNTSNGEIEPNDGKPITIGGVVYPKGLGVHSASEINVALNGNYTIFAAEVGIDDEVAEAGTVVFQVIADGETLYDSGTVTGADVAKSVAVNVAGKQQLKLVVTDGGDDFGSDHADWANARLRLK